MKRYLVLKINNTKSYIHDIHIIDAKNEKDTLKDLPAGNYDVFNIENLPDKWKYFNFEDK
jgi:hypothetical protein